MSLDMLMAKWYVVLSWFSNRSKSLTNYQICIFMGCVYAYVIILTFLGPEYRGRSMLARTDEDLAEAAGQRAIENVKHEQHGSVRHHSDSDIEKV